MLLSALTHLPQSVNVCSGCPVDPSYWRVNREAKEPEQHPSKPLTCSAEGDDIERSLIDLDQLLDKMCQNISDNWVTKRVPSVQTDHYPLVQMSWINVPLQHSAASATGLGEAAGGSACLGSDPS